MNVKNLSPFKSEKILFFFSLNKQNYSDKPQNLDYVGR